ncbi:NAD(P)-binding protein [Coniochaeta ligniaria NRRL 30616]|uniref:NAD(P)-binding protein n=1 Tax=Coniochaeta ligniaria NRRL 30616 TaxID=1408157 RepID=A0A1J7J105_9PEZI|nr:NAD(P)-binding protein [Coniochaeta ligniaria NRRL 30616]
MSASHGTQFPPRLHNDLYPFIYPKKFQASLQDKVTIITGSAGTIGKALAECFAVAGAKLVLVYNRTRPPPEFEERCRSLGARGVTLVQCNVADLQGCKSLVQKTLEAEGKVDILVNNAGANSLGPMHSQDPEQFIHEFQVNFHGPYALMRLVLPVFREQRSGCVLNIASRAGTVDIPYSTSYCSSKAALINLTGCTQKEIDIDGLDDIHLYALHPGGVKSEMTTKKYSDESLQSLPEHAATRFKGWLDIYTDSPYLNGMTCVALANGVARDILKGKYFDVGHDLEDVIAQSEAIKSDPELYSLHTTFPCGLSNLNPMERPKDEPFDFPGF